MLFRQALRLEPNNVGATLGLATTLSNEVYNGWVTDPIIREKQQVEARDLALRGKNLEPKDPRSYMVLADFSMVHGDHEGAIRLAETALSLDPKNPQRYTDAGTTYLQAGEPKRAIELLVQGVGLDPKNRATLARHFGNMAWAQFMLGDNEAAINWAQKRVDADGGGKRTYALLAMAKGRIGNLAGSREAVATLLRANPKFSLSDVESRSAEAFPPAFREYWETKLLPAWRLAGLPE